MKNLPKISAVIITYNQEKVIGRAIESILQQEVALHEIIIADDCSIDNNWEVIKGYQKKYPSIIKPYRHEKNLGIFGNLESTWSKPKGDLVIYVSGDDKITSGLFLKVVEYINKHDIDFEKGSFCIYSDSKSIHPDGKEKLRSNKLIESGIDAVSLKIRGLVGSGRGLFYSKELLNRFRPIKENIGIYTDGLYDVQVQLHSDKNYYVPYVGGVYYTGIGIASKTPAKDALISLNKLYQSFYSRLNLNFQDKGYLLSKVYANKYYLKPSFKKFALTWYYSILSTNYKYGMNPTKKMRQFAKMVLISFRKSNI